eukprot:CAMPEP_0197237234 /NCGR_PEP_ID=MMETSP1429-20130617/4127_1 /TAXON_ID=49237 /ORGANISM="Chaetoceros  sp., Strain UNC1202" /LENGTH=213 /DNA_ID=CAMNT_0042696201 /DNA_START=77 /DNA_END=718 /DNA_ORIENTATION=+
MKAVQINDLAYTKMMLHASLNSRTPIHGILLSSPQTSSNETVVSDALPVCHSTPTKPILDMALRLADAYCNDNDVQIVGWYTANERVGDDAPSPIAWKVISSMKSIMGSKAEPILAMITSESFEAMLRKECSADGSGKGFELRATAQGQSDNIVDLGDIKAEGNDWIEASCKVADICLEGGVQLFDFEQHLDGGVKGLKERDWLRNAQVAKLI